MRVINDFVARFLSFACFSAIIQNGCLKEENVGEGIAKKTSCGHKRP